MVYLISQKYTILSLQIKSLEFNYFICSVPPPWIANSGLLGLLQIPKSELRGHSRLNFWLGTFGLTTYSGKHHYLWMFFWSLAKILCALLKNVNFFYILFLLFFLGVPTQNHSALHCCQWRINKLHTTPGEENSCLNHAFSPLAAGKGEGSEACKRFRF